MDNAGDIAFVLGDNGTNPPSDHVYWLPAGTAGLVSNKESNLTDVSTSNPISAVQNPKGKSTAVRAVAMDTAGDVFIADSNIGVYEVPNENGVPNPAHSFIVTSAPAQGGLAIDNLRRIMVVPITQSFDPSKEWNGIGYFAQIRFDAVEFGTSRALNKTASSSATVDYNFGGSVTPASFAIVESGVQNPDFSITGGTCTTGIAYAANSGCLENIEFKPTSVGSISARLLMLDDKQNVLASIMLHGTGIGANAQVAPGVESTIGATLTTPTQLAADLAGNVYVADPGLGKVLMFAPGSTAAVSVGTGLTAPTGVAVNGAGEVFIADSGSVSMIPFGPAGLNAAGQVQLVSGLGANLNLAVDGLGDLYIADPTNAQVVKLGNIGASAPSALGQFETKLTAGFTAPSAVAVDAAGNLYVVDGANLFELNGGTGAPASLLNTLSGATGLAVDPSGAVYITSAGGTVRIPSTGGALEMANQTTIAADVAATSAIALDRAGNVYVTSSTGGGITAVSSSGTVVLATPADLTSSTSAPATITNSGNAPLVVTGYTSTNAADFTGADGTCIGDSTSPATGVAVGATCQVVLTFNPGPGEEGNLSGQIGVTGNAVNAPVRVNASAVGLPLTPSATAISVSGSAEVINAPLTVTIAPKSGTHAAVPSGQVTVSFPSWYVKTPSPCGASGQPNCVPTVYPQTLTATGTLDGTGKVTVQLSPVLAGNQAFTVAYGGDRVYGRSTQTLSSVVAKSAITGIKLPTLPDASDINLPFVPAGTGGGTVPYDGTETPWQYQFKMSVDTLAGVPTGPLTIMDDSSTCPAGTSTKGIGAATCALTNYKGVACPQSAGSGVLYPVNATAAGQTPIGAQATFYTSCLWNVPQGTTYSPVIYTHYIHPEYGGDANFLPYVGPTSTLFQSVRGPAVQITKTGDASTLTTAPSVTVTAGSSTTIDLTISSILGYGRAGSGGSSNNSNFPVSLACDISLPHGVCAITYDNSVVDPNQGTAPNSVQVPCPANANTTDLASGAISCSPGRATVTIYTNVAVGTTTSRNASAASITLAALFGFGMFGLFFRRRSFEKQRLLLMILMVAVSGALAIALSACSTTNLSPQAQLKTPSGTYQMTITAQSVGVQCIASGPQGSDCTTSNGGYGKLTYGSQNQVSLPFYVNVTVQ